jgi:Asp-tRNA(Asn)/Glu-tRNA(Gln) amidotransferase A subunit family amidase
MAGIVNEHLHYAPVTELAAAIRAKRVSSLEVVRTCLRRIAEVNPTVNVRQPPPI